MELELEMSEDIKNYFDVMDKKVEKAYEVASKARKKGFDPEDKVDVPLARGIAERVEGLVGSVAPEIINSGFTKRIKELEEEYGILDWRIAFKIAEEISKQKFCKFENEIKAMETAIRVGFAYLTLGVVSAPLEGFIELRVKDRKDGKKYVSAFYAGPVRGAGGTAEAVSVLLVDYVRRVMGYGVYDIDENEVNRYVTEVLDYHERITNLQYLPSEEEIRFLVKKIPVEINGDPTEKIEVSNYKDLKRVETNRIRGGVCLVIAEGLAQKATKIWKRISEWGKDFGLEDWSFLKDFLILQKKVKAKSEVKETSKKKILPDYTYISDLVAGRPVLAHPLANGGFRLRYGRCRVSGYSSRSISPLTMKILNNYIAIGTQLKVERPGKATVVSVCDSLDGPIVKLKKGDVVILDESNVDKTLNEIEEIIYLGDMLVNYGDFSENGHMLVPVGYCEEWWIQEVEKAAYDLLKENDIGKLSSVLALDEGFLFNLFNKPLSTKVDFDEAFKISKKLNVPMYPKYIFYWRSIKTEQFLSLISWLHSGMIKRDEDFKKIILPLTYDFEKEVMEKDPKRVLELIGLPHLVSNGYVIIEGVYAKALACNLGFLNNELKSVDEVKEFFKEKKSVLFAVNKMSEVRIRDKSGTFIGARMGRPEKAKMRKLVGSPQILFPVGKEGGRLRCFQSALDKGMIKADIPIYFCDSCNKNTIFSVCENCGKKTTRLFYCRICKNELRNNICKDHGPALPYKSNTEIDINYYFNSVLKNLDLVDIPELIKGVRGTSNKEHIPEHLSKGILRAKHKVYVNKDGTIRYDMTEMAITHFKPKEVGTSVTKLIQLGYNKDISGKDLVDDEQILELKPQDVILPSCKESSEEGADDVLFKVANFVDELLIKLYKEEPFYNLKSKEALVGHLIISLAPHTSAGIIGRIIGFSKTQGCFAHPMWHAAQRRDCLSFDSYVPVQNDDGWQIVKIGEFIETLNPNEKLDFYGTVGKKTSNLRTLSLGNSIDISLVKEVTKHRPSEMFLIETEAGRKIKITSSHRFYVLDKERIIEKRADEIKVGDKVISQYKIDIPEIDIDKIDLLEEFKGRDDICVRDIKDEFGDVIKERAKEKGLSWKSVENFYNRDSFPIKFLEDLGIDLRKIKKGFVSAKRDLVKLPLRIPLVSDLLEVLGFYIAEGFARKKNDKKGFYQVSIAVCDNELRRFVRGVFKKYFNLNPTDKKKDRLTFSSRILYELFVDILELGRNAKNKRFPRRFFNLKKREVGAILRGYFEGDGSVSLTDVRVTCDSVSEGLLKDLEFIFSRFGIFVKFYDYEKRPGPLVRKFYEKRGKVPKFKATKLIILSDFCNIFKDNIGFISEKKNKILEEICNRKILGTRINFDKKNCLAYLEIKNIKKINPEITYCFSVEDTHNFFVNNLLVHNCDGDECGIMLLLDGLLNFSRQYLPDKRGGRSMDSPLVLTSRLVPKEVDDMVHGMDVVWKYPLEFYEAALEYKFPWEVKIKQLNKRLGKSKQYEDFGFTHEVNNFNNGVRCSAYKQLPTMEEKVKGQMDLAEKIRAVNQVDVARLVIEKHFIKDIKGNLRKFSMQQFRCVHCNEKYRRPPLTGSCLKCGGNIIFTISEGSIVKYLEPAISLADKYALPPYLKQTLELTKDRVESVFGKEKERQEGLVRWFG